MAGWRVSPGHTSDASFIFVAGDLVHSWTSHVKIRSLEGVSIGKSEAAAAFPLPTLPNFDFKLSWNPEQHYHELISQLTRILAANSNPKTYRSSDRAVHTEWTPEYLA